MKKRLALCAYILDGRGESLHYITLEIKSQNYGEHHARRAELNTSPLSDPVVKRTFALASGLAINQNGT
jgi:hypothetical protein